MDSEQTLARLAALHFGLTAAIRFAALFMMVGSAPPLYVVSNLWPEMLVVLLSGTLAGLFARGVRRPRWPALAFSLLWSVLLMWSAEMFRSDGPLARGMVPGLAMSDAELASMRALAVTQAACFSAAAIVVLTGRPGRPRAVIGGVLVLANAVLAIWGSSHGASPHG